VTVKGGRCKRDKLATSLQGVGYTMFDSLILTTPWASSPLQVQYIVRKVFRLIRARSGCLWPSRGGRKQGGERRNREDSRDRTGPEEPDRCEPPTRRFVRGEAGGVVHPSCGCPVFLDSWFQSSWRAQRETAVRWMSGFGSCEWVTTRQ
jgi:hypothetical protein